MDNDGIGWRVIRIRGTPKSAPKLYEGFQLYRGGVRGDSIWITM